MTAAAVLHGVGDLRVEEVAPGPLTGDDGWIDVERCGVCGSDAGLLAGKIPATYPAVVGHEIVGVVAELGPGGAERHGVAVGDRVVLEFPMRCGQCAECVAGRYRLCSRARGYGGPVSVTEAPGLWGGMAERVYLSPQSVVHRVPDGVGPDVAALACAVLGNGVRWTVQLGGAGLGSSVVVLGCGPQGLACAAAARAAGATNVVAVGRRSSEHRMEIARLLGATATTRSDIDDPTAAVVDALGGGRADLVVDTTGAIEGALLGVPMVRTGGTLVVAGQSGAPSHPVDLDQLVEREITLVGANSHDTAAVLPALDILAADRFPFEAMVTHRRPLAAAREAIDLIRDPSARAVKVLVDLGGQ
jgi:alcohol dehydrogenase